MFLHLKLRMAKFKFFFYIVHVNELTVHFLCTFSFYSLSFFVIGFVRLKRKKMESDLELQLFSALDEGDVDALACHLDLVTSKGESLQDHLLSNLLVEAIRRNNPACVTLLIDEFGASLAPYRSEIDATFVYPSIEALIALENVTSYSDDRPNPPQFHSALKIATEILTSESSRLLPLPDDKVTSNHDFFRFLFPLATHFPRLALSFVKSIPIVSLQNHAPLDSIFKKITRYGGSELLMPHFKIIISCLVLPLLQSGSRLEIDIFSNQNSILLEELVRADYSASSALWPLSTATSMVLLIALESQRRKSVILGYDFNQRRNDFISPRCQKLFENFLQQEFPRSLQCFARQSILKCLPLGFHKRNHAISQLSLPLNLSEYLAFKEFEV